MSTEFTIIGGQRCATGWLARCLGEHPEIFMVNDEARFFERNYTADKNWRDCVMEMPSYRGQPVIGEKTANYLSHPLVAERIFENVPNMKLIAVLRNPVDRILSQYRYKSSLPPTLKNLKADTELWTDMIQRSRYAYHLRRFYNLFPPENIKIVYYESVCNTQDSGEPARLVQRLYRFLDVNADVLPPSLYVRTKPSSRDKQHALRLLVTRALLWGKSPFRKMYSRWTAVRPSECDPDIVKAVARELYFDLEELERMLGHPPNHWRTYGAI